MLKKTQNDKSPKLFGDMSNLFLKSTKVAKLSFSGEQLISKHKVFDLRNIWKVASHFELGVALSLHDSCLVHVTDRRPISGLVWIGNRVHLLMDMRRILSDITSNISPFSQIKLRLTPSFTRVEECALHVVVPIWCCGIFQLELSFEL